MPVYQAWIPVIAHVLIRLDTDEPLSRKELRNGKELAERFVDDGEPVISDLCEDCSCGLRLDLAAMTPQIPTGETFDASEVEEED